MFKKVIIFIYLVFSLILLMSCYKTDQKDTEIVSMQLGLNRSVKSAPVVIAEESGFFKKNNLDVVLNIEPSAINMMDSVINGKYDIVCVPEFQIVNYSFNNNDFCIIAVLNRNQSRSLIMNNDVLKSPAELAGTRIGLAGNSAGELYIIQIACI